MLQFELLIVMLKLKIKIKFNLKFYSAFSGDLRSLDLGDFAAAVGILLI